MRVDRVYYSVLKFVPDSIRGEAFNVALLAVCDETLHIKVFDQPSPLLRAILPRAVLSSLQNLDTALRRRFPVHFPSEDQHGEILSLECPTPGFLRFLSREGFAGLKIEAPLWHAIPDSDRHGIATVQALFERLVEPQTVRQAETLPVKQQRARTIVKELLNKNAVSPGLVPRRVLVRVPYAKRPRDFGFGFANGKITLGQVINFNVTEESQKQHADSAIALAFEMQTLLHEAKPCVNVLTIGDLHAPSQEHIRRLEQTGETLVLPRDEEKLLAMIQSQAHHDVAEALRMRGADVTVEGDTVDATITENRQVKR